MVVVRFTPDVDGVFQILTEHLKEAGFIGKTVAIKLHMGGGQGMFDPHIAKLAVDALISLDCKPFLFDTPVLYPGPRHFHSGYFAVAAAHGYTQSKMGCPIVISNEYLTFKTKNMQVEVSREMSNAQAMLVLTHVKGHACSAFGGAVKNLAMGCSSPKSKGDQHKIGTPWVNEKCTACGICQTVCSFGAINVTDKCHVNAKRCWGCSTCVYNCPEKALEAKATFEELMCEAAGAALEAMKGKPILYLNDVRKITKHCDCMPFPGKPVANDVGILVGADIAAIDKASLDLIKEQEGKIILQEIHNHDPYLTVIEAEKQGLGTLEVIIEPGQDTSSGV